MTRAHPSSILRLVFSVLAAQDPHVAALNRWLRHLAWWFWNLRGSTSPLPLSLFLAPRHLTHPPSSLRLFLCFPLRHLQVLEMTTWNQLGIHRSPKPVICLSVGGFYAPLKEQCELAVKAGFIAVRDGSLSSSLFYRFKRGRY